LLFVNREEWLKLCVALHRSPHFPLPHLHRLFVSDTLASAEVHVAAARGTKYLLLTVFKCIRLYLEECVNIPFYNSSNFMDFVKMRKDLTCFVIGSCLLVGQFPDCWTIYLSSSLLVWSNVLWWIGDLLFGLLCCKDALHCLLTWISGDMIYDMIYIYLTAVELTPGGSNTAHI
jgi:hypothetical protein